MLDNAPLSAALVLELRATWTAFFAAPDKDAYVPSPGNQDGYHPMSSRETALGAAAADLKEFFHWYPWGRQPPGVAAASQAFFDAGLAVASVVLGWLDECLPAHLAEPLPRALPSMLSGSRRTLLRIAHYPPFTEDEVDADDRHGAMRAAPHADINLVTVLPAADAPGLQVLARDGSWLDVPDDPGSLTINAGDMLQLLTDGVVHSASHRVINPVGQNRLLGRLSTPLFIQPADSIELVPGTTAFSFQADRLRAIRGIELTPLAEPTSE